MRTDDVDYLGTLRDRDLLPDDVTAVLSVGSYARGWANSGSDHDLYVVSAATWRGGRSRSMRVPLRPRTVPVQVVPVAGQRWEIKYWIDFQVEQMLAKVTWNRFENARSSDRVLTDTEERFLECLATCRPLHGHDWVCRRRDELAATAFRALVVTRSLSEVDGCVEDSLGQLDAGDIHSAVLSARKALGHVIDALLESHGQYGSRIVKWRARRFLEAAPTQLSFERYWALETMVEFDPAAPERWVNEVITLCRDLSLEVEV